jgi:hypothetical protein
LKLSKAGNIRSVPFPIYLSSDNSGVLQIKQSCGWLLLDKTLPQQQQPKDDDAASGARARKRELL